MSGGCKASASRWSCWGSLHPEESVGAREEADLPLLQALGQPVVLVQVDAGGEREVRADAPEQAAPGAIVDIEVVRVHPAPLVDPMPLLGGTLADADQNAGRLAGLENGHDPVGLGALEIRGDE